MEIPNSLNQSDKQPSFSGWALGLIVVGVAAAIFSLWWAGISRTEVNFLPAMGTGEWIVYPMPPAVNPRPKLELPTVFEHSFSLATVPLEARFRVAGFRRYVVSINGSALGPAVQTGVDWKHPDTYEVAALLRPGVNRIEVTVFNNTGPAALWANLEAGDALIASGDDWRTSLAGAMWRKAALATAPRPPAAYGAVYGLPDPWTALHRRWPSLLFTTLFVATGWWLARASSGCAAVRQRAVNWLAQSSVWTRWSAVFLPLAVAAVWLVLFSNNLTRILILTGFDSPGHLDYIRFIQEHHALPMANAGWEMFQPPLYYLISAGWLELLQVSAAEASGLVALRALGLAIGITHVAIVWAALKLLFPGKEGKAGWGVLLAAALPPVIYLSHAVTNEAFAAMMMSACVWLTLRVLQHDHLTWRMCVVLGLAIGAALLAKASALLLLPCMVGVLFWQWLKERKLAFAPWAGRIGLMTLLCALLCGWHYGRLWYYFGSPLVANWDARLGFSWWQDDGFRTSAFYFRGGDVFLHPWSGASQSLSDCLYATLWGDGLLSGSAGFFTRPPWDFDLMSIGYWLAAIPTVLVLAGGVLAVATFVRRPTPQWLFLLGYGALAFWSVAYISLLLPYYSLVKSFFALSALIPLCALGAWGLSSLMKACPRLAGLMGVAFLVWGANSFASFWVADSSVPWVSERAVELINVNRYNDAIELLEQRLRDDPDNADLQFVLAYLLGSHGQVEKSADRVLALMRSHPDDSRGPYLMAMAFWQRNQPDQAVAQIRKLIARNPVFDYGTQVFMPLQGVVQVDDAVDICRQALAVSPYNSDLRLTFGVLLLRQNQEKEARIQLEYVCRSNPESIDVLAATAWEKATSSLAGNRNGLVAVRLAEFVCDFTKYGNARFLMCLAAAHAEANQFPEALKYAEQAEAIAVGKADLQGVGASRDLLQALRNGQPYRQK